MSFPSLHESWKAGLKPVLQSEAGRALAAYLGERKRAGAVIHPPRRHWFEAFNSTPLSRVRVVLVGQDPYHGPGQAHGLAFSVRPGVKAPPSLKNILKEARREFGSGDFSPHLGRWAAQGVLLLNTVLTVEEGRAGSHRGRGWEAVTDAALEAVAAQRPGCVFMLWGSDARAKKALVSGKHKVLEAAHPSPLSAHRGFLGCGHFGLANRYFKKRALAPIQWT